MQAGAERTNTEAERSVALAVFDLVSSTRPAFQTSLMVFPLAFRILFLFSKRKLIFALFVFWKATKCGLFCFFPFPRECKL